MSTLLILTSGNGTLSAGRVVGHVAANTPQEAEDAVIASGQIRERWREFFRFEIMAGEE